MCLCVLREWRFLQRPQSDSPVLWFLMGAGAEPGSSEEQSALCSPELSPLLCPGTLDAGVKCSVMVVPVFL